MKSEKKVLASLLTLSTVFILFGCGSSVSTMNEKGAEEITDMVESGVSVDETIDKVEEIKEGEEEITDKPAEATASPTPTATPEPTSTPSPSPATPTPEPHVHQYEEAVTRQPSCSTEGEKQLVCQGCGDVKVEAIPATGNHNWEPVYQNVTHPSTGHVEQRETQIQTGTSAGYTVYSCGACGAQFDTPSGVSDHCKTFIGVDNGHAVANTIAYDYPGEPIYETVTESVWVVDVPETTTQEIVGYKCSICGATK